MDMSISSDFNDDEDINNIPLADDDPDAVIQEGDADSFSSRLLSNIAGFTGTSFESLPSTFTTDSFSSAGPNSLDLDGCADEKEEKAGLISQVLELQNTLDDLSQRVDNVKEENLKLKSENQVLGQYIESLMSASSVFQPTSPQTAKKK